MISIFIPFRYWVWFFNASQVPIKLKNTCTTILTHEQRKTFRLHVQGVVWSFQSGFLVCGFCWGLGLWFYEILGSSRRDLGVAYSAHHRDYWPSHVIRGCLKTLFCVLLLFVVKIRILTIHCNRIHVRSRFTKKKKSGGGPLCHRRYQNTRKKEEL